MKKILFFSLFIALSSLKINAQCLKIERFLVDACSNPSTSGCVGTFTNEGLSEMVLFKVGTSSLSVSGLTVDWPNNTFSSWLAPNALTASNVSYLNSTILGCGAIIEPTMGVLPANKRVLAITSASMCLVGNSFANLSDTLIVIFQSGSILTGHFTNHNNSGSPTSSPTGAVDTRTLSLIYSANNCTNTVVYDRSLLTNTLGTYGGPNTMNDGASVVVSPLGAVSYSNEGCKAPFIPLSIAANLNSTVCLNTPLSITSTVSGGYFNSITWTGGTGTFAATSTTNTSNTYTPGIGDNGVITLSATASRTCTGGGQTASTTFTFAILQSPAIVTSATNTAICPAQSGVLSLSVTNSANTGSYSVLWSNAATTLTNSVSSGGLYTSTVTGQCGVPVVNNFSVTVSSVATITSAASTNTSCAGNTVTLTANSSTGTYTWNTGSNAASIVVSPTITTTYTVSSANTCTNVSSIRTITVTPLPTFNLNTNVFNICGTQSASIIATSTSATSYSWSNGATTNSIVTIAAGVYTVFASNSCGNSVAQTATVITGAAPSFSINSSSLVLCPSQQATLTTAGSTGSFTWSTGQQSSAIIVNTPGTYTANLSNSCGTATSSIVISQQNLPPLNLVTTASLLCVGQTASLSAGFIPLTYNLLWSGPGIVGSTNFNTIAINAGGVYTLTATDAITGCSTSTIINVASGNTNANFVPNVFSGPAPLNVNFTNQSTGANTYSWVLGNGSSQTTTNTSSTYNATGNYIVTLFASIDGKCTTQYSVDIKVTEGLGIVPEVVTPNGDNLNDYFVIKGLDNYLLNELQIYNRWGNLVYSSKPYANDWNGMPNAKGKTGSNKLPSGTYYYILQLNDADLTTFKGYVQLEY